ncbi:MAG: hypothetical protein K8R68_09350, partial [Bacteroidales bacterium]|nr:hypothetical protein [Bacteroidales bacterium]
MLTIRKNQIEELEKVQEEKFIDRMVNHLKTNFSKELDNKDIQVKDIRQLIIKAIDDAKKYNVLNESDVRLYIECIALLGPNFDRTNKFPQINDILNRINLTGEEKMDLVSELLT